MIGPPFGMNPFDVCVFPSLHPRPQIPSIMFKIVDRGLIHSSDSRIAKGKPRRYARLVHRSDRAAFCFDHPAPLS